MKQIFIIVYYDIVSFVVLFLTERFRIQESTYIKDCNFSTPSRSFSQGCGGGGGGGGASAGGGGFCPEAEAEAEAKEK